MPPLGHRAEDILLIDTETSNFNDIAPDLGGMIDIDGTLVSQEAYDQDWFGLFK